ncbi:MAG: CPBP family intramembrane metalloprotease [Chloroflexi bacterium]|nr:CPBP family intramembrane metalloprotease [Chloroflexota bacterium]
MAAPSRSELRRPAALRRFASAFVAASAYPPTAADLRTVSLVGLELPIRAAFAIAYVTLAVLFDFSRTFIPESIQDLGRAAEAMRFQAIERLILFGLAPLAIVVLAYRESPAGYGLRLGDWRWGIGLAVAGMTVMTPVVLALAAVPQFRDYYSVSAASSLDIVVTHALDLIPAEFMFRGFLLFTLVRAFGPIGVLIATLPFVFSHLGKPEIELFSTLFGGLAFGWLNWRTGSILYSAVAHVWIISLMLIATGG